MPKRKSSLRLDRRVKSCFDQRARQKRKEKKKLERTCCCSNEFKPKTNSIVWKLVWPMLSERVNQLVLLRHVCKNWSTLEWPKLIHNIKTYKVRSFKKGFENNVEKMYQNVTSLHLSIYIRENEVGDKLFPRKEALFQLILYKCKNVRDLRLTNDHRVYYVNPIFINLSKNEKCEYLKLDGPFVLSSSDVITYPPKLITFYKIGYFDQKLPLTIKELHLVENYTYHLCFSNIHKATKLEVLYISVLSFVWEFSTFGRLDELMIAINHIPTIHLHCQKTNDKCSFFPDDSDMVRKQKLESFLK